MIEMANKVVSVFLTIWASLTAGLAYCAQPEPADCYSGIVEDSVLVVDESLCGTHDFSFRKQFKLSGERVGSFVYRAFNNPERVRNQAAGTVILYGLDYIGFGESVREGVTFIKQNTRFTFGDCGKVQLRANRVTAGTCITSNSSLEWNSSYDFDSIQLRFNWFI